MGQQPVNISSACGVEFSGLFESRARRKYFINNLLKTDCQRGAILVQVRYSVYGGLVKCGGRVVSHLAGR